MASEVRLLQTHNYGTSDKKKNNKNHYRRSRLSYLKKTNDSKCIGYRATFL